MLSSLQNAKVKHQILLVILSSYYWVPRSTTSDLDLFFSDFKESYGGYEWEMKGIILKYSSIKAPNDSEGRPYSFDSSLKFLPFNRPLLEFKDTRLGSFDLANLLSYAPQKCAVLRVAKQQKLSLCWQMGSERLLAWNVDGVRFHS